MKQERPVLAKVIAHAWKDPNFKKKLLSSPEIALAEMGVSLPKNLRIRVIEEAPGTYTLILPPAPEREIANEGDLEQIAAGIRPPFFQ